MAKKKQPRRPQATLSDLLGSRKHSSHVPRKWQEAYGRLLRAREQLNQQQNSLAEDTIETLQHTGMHMADAGTDASERDLALGLRSFDRETLHQIDQAIERMRNGTYGICELTGKPISQQRLKAVPWTRFSAQAERQLEQEGQLKRAGAGRRDFAEVTPASEEEEGVEEEAG